MPKIDARARHLWLRGCIMAGTSTVLSESEKQFILGGVKDDVRSDGRCCRHVRHFDLKKGVVSNTSGSAMIERVWRLSAGSLSL